MKHWRQWIRPVLFTLGGAVAGLIYYYVVGCSTGTCAITSNPISSMVYMSIIGWLVSGIFTRGCAGGCSM